MITANDINQIMGITESFLLPERMMQILLSGEKSLIFDRFRELESDLSFDWFTDYFQEEHANRNAMMQDFTPKELTQLLPELACSTYTKVLDVCAGTGGLTIGAWSKNPNAFFVCEELSQRALPLLMFNMSIRNINGYVINKNILSGEVMGIYRLDKSERYSEIVEERSLPELKDFDLVVMNPPYSLKHEWKETPEWLRGYEPPTKAADYGFILYGMSKMQSGATLCAILPHGVLFRGQKEGVIREKLIRDKRIRSIIGLPDKLFLNTQIPVCVMVIGEDENEIFFIDASKKFVKEGKQNVLRKEDVNEIANTYHTRTNVERYSSTADFSELESNDFNLNIPRYVDTTEKAELPKMGEVIRDLMDIDSQIQKTEFELSKMLKNLKAQDPEDQKTINAFARYCQKKKVNNGYEQLSLNL